MLGRGQQRSEGRGGERERGGEKETLLYSKETGSLEPRLGWAGLGGCCLYGVSPGVLGFSGV